MREIQIALLALVGCTNQPAAPVPTPNIRATVYAHAETLQSTLDQQAIDQASLAKRFALGAGDDGVAARDSQIFREEADVMSAMPIATPYPTHTTLPTLTPRPTATTWMPRSRRRWRTCGEPHGDDRAGASCPMLTGPEIPLSAHAESGTRGRRSDLQTKAP